MPLSRTIVPTPPHHGQLRQSRGDRNSVTCAWMFLSNPRIVLRGSNPAAWRAPISGILTNAAEISALAPFVASYASTQVQSDFERPDPSDLDSDDDGVTDWQDPFPVRSPRRSTRPESFRRAGVFPNRVLTGFQRSPAPGTAGGNRSGSDQVLAFDIDGSFRSVAGGPGTRRSRTRTDRIFRV